MNRKQSLALVLLLPFAVAMPARSQSGSQLQLLPESRVWVEGTSTRDNWTVQATELNGFVSLDPPADGSIRVREGGFAIPAAKLEGGRSTIMDRLMHGALKAAEHPTISYRFVSGTTAESGSGKYTIGTKGILTLAGVTKEIEGTAVAERLSNGQLRFTGSYPLLMTDYEITPPTAMLGALRTGDRVVVHYELLVSP